MRRLRRCLASIRCVRYPGDDVEIVVADNGSTDGTREVLENERRGLFSYQALKSRLETNKYETAGLRDFAQPLVDGGDRLILGGEDVVLADQFVQSGLAHHVDHLSLQSGEDQRNTGVT